MRPTELVLDFARACRYLAACGRPHQLGYEGDHARVDYREGDVAAEITMRPLASGTRRAWLALSSALGPVDGFSLRGALVANDELPLGGLANLDGTMILRQTLPLASTTFAHLEHAWFVLAHTTSTIRRGTDGELAFVWMPGGRPEAR